MRIYVSGSLQDITAVRTIQRRLRTAGHTITYDWTEEGITPNAEEAERQITQGVYEADLLVLVDYPRGKGKYIEVGHALAHDIPVVRIIHNGAGDSLFWKLPNVHTVSFFDLVPQVAALDPDRKESP